MRRSARDLWFSAAVVGLGLAMASGCGTVSASNDGGGSDGSDDSDGRDAAPLTTAEACGQMSRALCDRLSECAPFLAEIFYGNAATCRERVALGCTKDQEVPDTARTTADVVACATATGSAACNDLLADNFPEVCRIKPGARRDGEGCGSSWQCQSTHCEKGTAECGTCAPRRAAGGDCTVNGGCQQGLVCANQKCVAPGMLGATCDANRPCLGTLYCNGSVCANHLAPGEACGYNVNACDFAHGFGCNGFANPPICETVASAEGGQACGLLNGTLTLCVLFNECAGVTLTAPGVCAAPAADGTACSEGHACLPPATCAGGVCRLPSVGSCAR